MQDKFWNSPETVSQFANRPCSSYITSEIEKLIGEGNVKNAIDIGCGGGRYSVYLNNRYIEVLAVDKNKAMVDYVKGLGINAVQCDMTNVCAPECNFDMVLSIGVLHNATTESEFCNAVKEIARVLKQNHYAIISVFTNDVVTADLTLVSKNCYALAEGRPPMVLYSEKEIIEVFNHCGLDFIKIIDKHITNVGTGERNVLSLLFRKR